jgi:hypothetical protein
MLSIGHSQPAGPGQQKQAEGEGAAQVDALMCLCVFHAVVPFFWRPVLSFLFSPLVWLSPLTSGKTRKPYMVA